MTKYLSITTLLLGSIGIAHAQYPQTKFSIEQCLHAALAAKNGGVVKVELKTEDNIPTYEFDI